MIRRHATMATVLVVVWVALWGEISLPNMASGVVVAVVTLILVPHDRPGPRGTFRLGPAVGFGWFFLRELVAANVEVAWEVVTPHNRENEGIISLPVPTACSPTLLMTIVNAISLTPGTAVVEIVDQPRLLFIHVLHLDDREESRSELMEFQRRAIAAFGSPTAIEELNALETEWGIH